MPYVRARHVTSPKYRLTSPIRVLCDPGPSSGGGLGRCSVAEFVWDGRPRVGIRWNGNSEHPAGNPCSRLPTWFVVPPELEDAVRQYAAEQNSS
jgi:hypothetical protein